MGCHICKPKIDEKLLCADIDTLNRLTNSSAFEKRASLKINFEFLSKERKVKAFFVIFF